MSKQSGCVREWTLKGNPTGYELQLHFLVVIEGISEWQHCTLHFMELQLVTDGRLTKTHQFPSLKDLNIPTLPKEKMSVSLVASRKNKE